MIMIHTKCVSSSTVFISNTLPFHNAMYSCMAINSAGKSIESSELTITGMKIISSPNGFVLEQAYFHVVNMFVCLNCLY